MPEPSPLVVGRFMRLARRSSDTWQGGLVKMPLWVGKPGETPLRPWGGVCVSLETGLVNVKLGEGDVDWRLTLDALLELGLRFARTRPACLEVADRRLGESIVHALGDPELAVRVTDDIWLVKERVREMAESTGDGPLPPDAMDARGVTVERMSSFAAAAREFYEAAPWRYLSDEDLIRVEAPAVARGLANVTVLGGAGQTFGLGFFGSAKEFDRVREEPSPAAILGREGRWSVLFGPIDEMPFGDVDLWEEHALPSAGPSAYPVAMWFGSAGEIRRPEAPVLADMEAILRALARASEDQIDQGRWGQSVPTPDGTRLVTLAIPELLLPPDAPPRPSPGGLPDRRVMERVMLEIQRFAASGSFESEAELSAAIQQKFSGRIDDLPSTATTPLERAQDLVYRGLEARGRRRVQLARRAIELSQDCADAYVLLAESALGPDEARALYAEGVAAGERALGTAAFTEEAGPFWARIETRPYMRARFGLAQTLDELERGAEAVDHYRELLRLNPDDNQGVRYSLVAALLRLGRDAEAGLLLEQFGDEPTALWGYARALHAFRCEGESPGARALMRAALSINRHVPAYLLGKKTWPGPMPAAYALGSQEEAAVADDLLGNLWRATPAALRWLAAQARSLKPGKRRRR
ncbi:MAG: hypothetical protein L0027_03120 [Candidatus Rokubacteria bacterium]|nr:hypothetical protein [Candidatus Rokubacteria bacterium]